MRRSSMIVDRRGASKIDTTADAFRKGPPGRTVNRPPGAWIITQVTPGEVNRELGPAPKSNPARLAPPRFPRLLGRFPWLAAWLRRRSARLLARQRSPEAILALANAVTRGEDPGVFTIAMDVLAGLTEQPLIDAACVAWAASRHPALARLQSSHGWVASAPLELLVLSALAAGRPEAVARAGTGVVGPLVHWCEDADPAIAARARAWLGSLSNPDSVDELCGRWANTREALLGEAIVQAGYQARHSLSVRVLTALKAGRIEALEEEGPDAVGLLVLACSDVDPRVRQHAALALEHLRRQDAIEELCRLVLEEDDPAARSIALARGYRPRDDHQRALFFFLTGQLERYEDLDFDGRLLRGSYDLANDALKQRIRSSLKAIGRVDVLSVVGAGDRRGRLALMTPEETGFVVERLAGQHDWPRLWPLAFELPYQWAVAIVGRLAAQEWRPEAADERATFDELAELVSRTIPAEDEEFSRSLPPAVQRAAVRVSSIVNDVAFSTDGSTIALALRRKKVVVWDYQRGAIRDQLGGFRHAISRVSYAPGGTLLCAERSIRAEEACAIYARTARDGTRKIGGHDGAVTSIEPLSDALIFSTGRDGRLALWETGSGRLVRDHTIERAGGEPGVWARAARVSADGRLAVLLYDGLGLVRLPELDQVSSLAHEGKSKCAAFSPDGRALIVGQFDGEFRAYALQGDSIDDRAAAFGRLGGQAQGVETISDRSVIVTAGAQGAVAFTSWPNRAAVGSVSLPSAHLTTLRISPDGSTMAVGDSDASLTLWDLRVLEVPLLLARPLGLAVPVHLSIVRALAGDGGMPVRVRDSLRFLECLLRYRFRYDIVVDDLPGVRPGDFEIAVG